MSMLVIVGTQWGDEGKGKVALKFAKRKPVNTGIRYQGGPNAGHTTYIPKRLITHGMPVTISLGPEVYSMTAFNSLSDPEGLMEEFAEARRLGLEVSPDTFGLGQFVTLNLWNFTFRFRRRFNFMF